MIRIIVNRPFSYFILEVSAVGQVLEWGLLLSDQDGSHLCFYFIYFLFLRQSLIIPGWPQTQLGSWRFPWTSDPPVFASHVLGLHHHIWLVWCWGSNPQTHNWKEGSIRWRKESPPPFHTSITWMLLFFLPFLSWIGSPHTEQKIHFAEGTPLSLCVIYLEGYNLSLLCAGTSLEKALRMLCGAPVLIGDTTVL